jgi:hypothetical protein
LCHRRKREVVAQSCSSWRLLPRHARLSTLKSEVWFYPPLVVHVKKREEFSGGRSREMSALAARAYAEAVCAIVPLRRPGSLRGMPHRHATMLNASARRPDDDAAVSARHGAARATRSQQFRSRRRFTQLARRSPTATPPAHALFSPQRPRKRVGRRREWRGVVVRVAGGQ